MTNHDSLPQAGRSIGSILVEYAILAALALAAIFLLGVTVGFFGSAKDGAPNFGDFAIGGALLLLAALCCWQLAVRTMRSLRIKPARTAPSVHKVRSILVICLVIGAFLGAAVALISIESGAGDLPAASELLFSSNPLPTGIAVALLIGLVLIAVLSIGYYRNIDEQDRASQEYASLIAFNTYLAVTAAWWLAARGRFAPPVDHAAIFFLAVAVWTVIWLWRRYR